MSSVKAVVLKFGGSVLHSQDDFDRIQKEIQRFISKGHSVIAVVSAYFGVTERLIERATGAALCPDSVAYAELIAGGEFQSATELVSHLLSHDVSATVKLPCDVRFIATGERRSAMPVSVDSDQLVAALEQTQVLVVPGFSAIDQEGNCVLLGRGGSDISAVCMAHALGLDSVRLLKDVDGLYDCDPNRFDHAIRLPYVDYQTATRIGGELIQTEAIEFAASKRICIDVAGIGESFVSRIGPRLGAANTTGVIQHEAVDRADLQPYQV
jgi:homoserine dehydrogenase